VVEFDDEVILEIGRHAAAVAGGVAHYFAFGGQQLHVRAFVQGINDHVGAVGARKGEAETGGPLGGRNFGGHVVVGQVHAVVVGAGLLGFVRKPAGALVFLEAQFPGDGHEGKLAVVVHPRRRLVRLLEAANLVGAVLVGPAVAHFAGLRHPEVHAPGQGNGRVGVAVREGGLGVGAHERVHQVHGA
jgi:hypothetical protein